MHRSLLPFLLPLAAFAQSGPPAKAPLVPTDLAPRIETLKPGVKMTLLAEHPALVTPTGIDVDEKGRIWLAASHTHHRPEGYAGPQHDEILVFDADGKNRCVFYNKTDATMHVECGPDGWLYLAERDRIMRVKDSDGDGAGDVEENLATLDTVSDYPHNGLSGMAWHPDGGLVFSLGENFGKDWTLTGTDGVKVSGRGEGGVFRCTADGKGLRRIARGFWNPFGLLVRADGEIFAAENDPGSRPPCRLLNIVEGADYGFQWVYGSAPVHPFIAWNGELRGTLGMVHPCGEGPCALAELGGGVMIPSWSDHSIDYFPLTPKGAGYTSERIPLVRGSEFFRPVCIAQGPDGAFYLTDWVYSSYPIHGRGRLWKLEIEKQSWIAQKQPETPAAALAKKIRAGHETPDVAELLQLARGNDKYLADAALTALSRSKLSVEAMKALPPNDRVWAFVAMRRADLNDTKWVRAFLDDPDAEMRFECLRWIADAVLKDFQPQVEAMLSDSKLDFRLFEAVLATWNTLRGEPGAGVTNAEVLVERITNPQTPARLKGYAMRLAPPTHKALTLELLRDFANSNDVVLQLEAIRTLAARRASADIAADEKRSPQLRAEAILGTDDTALLQKLAQSDNAMIREEAQRALPRSLPTNRPAFDDTAAWLKLLAGPGDVETGRRIFFNSKVAICSTCHRHSGRGNVVGPDLTLIAQQGDRAAILRSILEPHREVAPQFYPSIVELKDGTTFTGILLRSSNTEVFRDLTGKEKSFPETAILKRTELRTSLMPPGLALTLTDTELRDLMAFLTQ